MIVTLADDIITSDKENYDKWASEFKQYFLVYYDVKSAKERGDENVYDILFCSSYLDNTWSRVSTSVNEGGTFSATFSRKK